MKTSDVLKILGVAAVAIAGYYYYQSLNDYDEYYDDDYNDDDNLRDCSDYTPSVCLLDGTMQFKDPNGNDVQITEDCCVELGYQYGGDGRNACLCDTPGRKFY